jgi:hypothetical protein
VIGEIDAWSSSPRLLSLQNFWHHQQGWIHFISNSSCVFFVFVIVIAAVAVVVDVVSGATPFQIIVICMQGTHTQHTCRNGGVPPYNSF